jgi:hypothetical protein
LEDRNRRDVSRRGITRRSARLVRIVVTGAMLVGVCEQWVNTMTPGQFLPLAALLTPPLPPGLHAPGLPSLPGLPELRASASVAINVGLDPATRNFLERMPAEMREESLRLLREALPIIDRSVLSYLQEVENVINRQVDRAPCKMAEIAGAGVSTVPKAFGFRPKPVRGLRDAIHALDTAAWTKRSLNDLSIEYVDLLYDVWLTGCEVSSVPPALREVSVLQADVRRRDALWARLQGRCDTAQSCAATVPREAARVLNNAHPDDVRLTKARERLDSNKVPSDGWLRSVTLRQYEESLLQLYRVEDELVLFREARASMARKVLAAVKPLVTPPRQLDSASLLQGNDCRSIIRVRQSLIAVNAEDEALLNLVNGLRNYSTDVAAEVDASGQTLRSAIDLRNGLTNRARQEILRLSTRLDMLRGTRIEQVPVTLLPGGMGPSVIISRPVEFQERPPYYDDLVACREAARGL